MKKKAILLSVCLAVIFAALPAKAAEVEATLKALKALVAPSVNDWRFQFGGDPGGQRVDLDDSSWKLVSPEHSWNGDDGRAWYRKSFVVPESIEGFPVAGRELILNVGTDDDGEIFINGEKKKSFHWETQFVLTPKARPGETMQVTVLVKNVGGPGRLMFAQLFTPELKKLSALTGDYANAIEWALRYADADPADAKLCRAAAEKSVAKVDLDAIKAGSLARYAASIEKAKAELKPIAPVARKYGVDLIGNAHIDLAWLWRWTEAREVCKSTFTTMDQLMKEYPEFKFTQSQAQCYAWMEERYPELFKEIQKRVKEGRWELTGAMWVEPDCNIPSGEAFVRQLLYGKRYFQQKFGVDVKTGWNPDTFGFAWTLPQIYKKAGVDNFVSWRMRTDWALHLPGVFWWQSPDGSKVLTALSDFYGSGLKEDVTTRALSFAKEASGVGVDPHVYGVGDHGGGPTRGMLDVAEKLRKTEYIPTVRYAFAEDYFEMLRKSGKEFPVRNEELFNGLNGCLTPQAAVKAGNRKCEILLGEAETFGVIASLYGKSYTPWDYESLWRPVLMNQFHDILSGTGIEAIYKDTLWDYAKAQAGGSRLMDASLETLGAKINTAGSGKAIVVYNPLSWERADVVRVELPAGSEAIEVEDADGRFVPSVLENEAGKRQLVFVAEKVPAVGYKLYRLIENPATSRSYALTDTDDMSISNQFLRVTPDRQTGCISVYDKVNDRQAFDSSGKGNLLQTFDDAGNAWSLARDFEKKMWDLNQADSVERIENGPVRQVIRVKKHFQKSTFVQDLTLYNNVPRLDCRTKVSWNDSRIMLKAAFPMAEKSDVATYEIAYGAIERSTHSKTELEQYKFEVSGQKWADISGKDFGVSILNDSKYSWDCRENMLRLTLLRSTTDPDPRADLGEHEFTYSIYPHKGDWKAGGTVRKGYELNTPLIARIEAPHAGTLPASHSFVSVGPENVVLGALKRAEDDGRWIVRIYECNGQPAEASITLPQAPRQVHETDLLEKNAAAIKADGRTLRVPIKPWEIRTLAVEF